MKSLGIAIKKNEIFYSLVEGINMDSAIISDMGKQIFRSESDTLMMDMNNIFTELLTKYHPDVVSFKLSLDVSMSQIPYMHYSLGVLNLLCLQKGILTIERSNRWITANKKSKITQFDDHFAGESLKNERLAASLVAWFALGE